MKDKKIKIGIVRGLLYYKYIAMWEEFFKQLDCEVLRSPFTNKDILTKGVSVAIDESCLAVKIFLGHVDYIKDKVDYVLVPRIESLIKDELLCSKFLGLPDIVRNSFDDIKVLDFSISIEEKTSIKHAFLKLGKKFSSNPFKIRSAYKKACEAQNKFEEDLEKGIIPKEISDKWVLNNKGSLKIALLGHPYNVYDEFLGIPIIKKLNELDAEIKTVEAVDQKIARELSKKISEKLYWTYNKEILGAAQYYLNKGIDGIIFLVSFPCGPDSLTVEMAIKKIKNKIPIMVLVLDELQAEAGLQTRLESFTDILKMQKDVDYAAN
jgi:predicted nucleotide-binding protein (sugar kinase/HSP70/actin superfamily)